MLKNLVLMSFLLSGVSVAVATSAHVDDLQESPSANGHYQGPGYDLRHYALEADVPESAWNKLEGGDRSVLKDPVILTRLKDGLWRFQYHEKGMHREEWKAWKESMR